MSAMRVLRFASAARAGSVSRPSSLWRPTKCAWMFGRRPGAPCSDTANTSVPWEDSLQDTTRLYPSPGDCLGFGRTPRSYGGSPSARASPSGRLVQCHGEGTSVRQLNQIAGLDTCQHVRVPRLHGLGVVLKTRDHQRALLGVDGGDGGCHGHLALDGAGGNFAGLGGDRRVRDRDAGFSLAGRTHLDDERLVINKDKRTVTLVGPQGGTLTLTVQDPQKLDALKVGDPVVATYYEALVIQVRPAREAKPGVSVTDATVTTKPGEIPAGAVESQVTVTAAISAVDAQKGTLMITSLQDDAETVKARNPNMLAGVKAGDLVQLTYTRALAVALDKPAGR